MRLVERFGYLGSILDNNWGGGGSDLPPTDSEVAFHKELQQQLATVKQHYAEFLKTLPASMKGNEAR